MVREKNIIGFAEYVSSAYFSRIPARIDTGARTTTIWASEIREENGVLNFKFFAKGSEYFKDVSRKAERFDRRVVMSSNGHKQTRYVVPIVLKIKSRQVRTFMTLADRSKNAFPMLIGRNTLRGKFLVDAQKVSRKLAQIDKKAAVELQSELKGGKNENFNFK